jgi:HD-GYP domain-containing protein (c-di-GMP phosphodiesterase class II)
VFVPVQAGGDGIGVLSVQSSYPAGIAGEMVDRFARAISVIDAYSAMTLDRPYHRAIAEVDALRELERCAGTQFDPMMVASFVAMRRHDKKP